MDPMNQPIGKPEEGESNLHSEELAAAEQEEQVPEELQQALEQAHEEMASDVMEEDVAPAAEYETEIAEMKDQLVRAAAEMENVRKRAERDLEEANKYAISGFARNMISVLENLQRAVESIPDELKQEHEAVKNLSDGVEMTLRELLAIFEKYGVTRVHPQGEKFDHNFHQAVSQVSDPKAEDGTILQVLQAGYVIHDRLLQPAMVVVAKNADDEQLNTQA